MDRATTFQILVNVIILFFIYLLILFIFESLNLINRNDTISVVFLMGILAVIYLPISDKFLIPRIRKKFT
ncbi:MAG: hypothetical protein ACW967_04640 [Candidatus Hodarchaeales archaeon]